MRPSDRALLKAARSGKTLRMAQLLNEGAGVNCAGPDGNTPLLCAAWAGHEDVVRFLIERGAELNSRAHDDATAL